MAGEFLCEFSHPDQWDNIYNVIFAKLGPAFHEWDGGLRFERGWENTVIVIFHHDKQQNVRVFLKGIAVSQPGVAGGWFAALRREKERLSASIPA